MKIWFFVISVVVGVVVADNAETKLKQGRDIFYSEIGCKPITETGNRYECPDVKTTINKDKCYFAGKEYPLGTELTGKDGLYKHCQGACFCRESLRPDGLAKFNCAHIDCPEYLGADPILEGQKCIRTYEDEKCCSTGRICDAELEARHQCHYDGKSYYEGERIYPEGDCYVCSCTKDFDNSTIAGNPKCEQLSCNVRHFNNDDLYNGCAPIFYKSVCCPIEFKCPTSSDKVISEGRSEDGVCKFGNLEVGIGGEVESGNEDTICRCVAPPMLECLKTPVYPKL